MKIFQKKRRLLYVPIFGGLGNQMFQMAHALNISNKENYKLQLLDYTKNIGIKRNWNLDCFGIEPTKISFLKNKYLKNKIKLSNYLFKAGFKENLGILNEEHIKKNQYNPVKKKICIGYWQDEKYFNCSINKIMEYFSFPKNILKPICLKQNILGNTVAVHIRRGDYISDITTRKIHYVCDENWYLKSIKAMSEMIEKPKFFVFSDDLSYSKEILKGLQDLSISFIPSDSRDWYHMYLMTFCKNFIISNSSYSWWGSYLSKAVNKKIICPRYWNKKQLTNSIGIYRNEFILM